MSILKGVLLINGTDIYEEFGTFLAETAQDEHKNYDELPLFLNAAIVANVLGVSPSSGYELMHEQGFPALRIGSRIVIPKEAFIRWVEEHTGGTA